MSAWREFERRCEAIAVVVEDRMLRDISSPIIGVRPSPLGGFMVVTERDLAYEAAWPMVHRAIVGRFPWEGRASPEATQTKG